MSADETDEFAGSVGDADDIVAASAPGSARRGKRNLTVLMLVLAAGTTAAALFAKRGPQAAVASAIPPATIAARQPHASESSGIRIESTPVPIDDIVAKFRFAPADVQVPLADLKSDPFKMVASSTQPVQLPDDAAEHQRHEQERQAALEGVRSLHLASIQHDEIHRTCTINGALYQEGQEVDGFVVEEIATTAVVVRKDVYRFELRVR